MIEIRQVSKIYGKKTNRFVALDDVSFSVAEGSRVAIVGKSGSGKSTLMHVMSGLDRATSGQVVIDGRDLMQLKSKDIDRFRAREMSFIFQSFFVQGNETCYENVSMPLEIANVPYRQRKKRVLAALEAVELSEKVGQKAKNLSGGQKQRLAIARVIARKPEILLFDDSFSALDYKTDKKLREVLKEKLADTTKLIVAQRISTIMDADQIIVLDEGHIFGQGTHEELLESNAVYQEIAYSQLSKEELAHG